MLSADQFEFVAGAMGRLENDSVFFREMWNEVYGPLYEVTESKAPRWDHYKNPWNLRQAAVLKELWPDRVEFYYFHEAGSCDWFESEFTVPAEWWTDQDNYVESLRKDCRERVEREIARQTLSREKEERIALVHGYVAPQTSPTSPIRA